MSTIICVTFNNSLKAIYLSFFVATDHIPYGSIPLALVTEWGGLKWSFHDGCYQEQEINYCCHRPLEFWVSYILKNNLVPSDWYKIIMLSTMDDVLWIMNNEHFIWSVSKTLHFLISFNCRHSQRITLTQFSSQQRGGN